MRRCYSRSASAVMWIAFNPIRISTGPGPCERPGGVVRLAGRHEAMRGRGREHGRCRMGNIAFSRTSGTCHAHETPA